MGFVFIPLAVGLAFVASKLDRHDRAARWFLFGAAALNAVAFAVALLNDSPMLWKLSPQPPETWW